VVYNGHHEALPFTLPSEEYGREWSMCLDTANPDGEGCPTLKPLSELVTEPRSVVVMHCPRDAE
jgi:glycogen operon protein